eukprot:scaffold333514_cov24-Prasinocladus_malaysianus.AAC.1
MIISATTAKAAVQMQPAYVKGSHRSDLLQGVLMADSRMLNHDTELIHMCCKGLGGNPCFAALLAHGDGVDS